MGRVRRSITFRCQRLNWIELTLFLQVCRTLYRTPRILLPRAGILVGRKYSRNGWGTECQGEDGLWPLLHRPARSLLLHPPVTGRVSPLRWFLLIQHHGPFWVSRKVLTVECSGWESNLRRLNSIQSISAGFDLIFLLLLFPSTFLERLCTPIYETLRPLIIKVQHLETLAELCHIFRIELIEEQTAGNPST